jgi:ATP-dependent DNA helicase RecG
VRREDLLEIIADVQRHQSELEYVEAKTARGGMPSRLFESLSAFSNRNGGGVILFGIDESQGFVIVGVEDAHRLQSEIGDVCAAQMEPPLRPEFTVENIDGKTVLAVEIAAVNTELRPCYYKTAGMNGGSYIRVGISNRRMSDYEIFSYVSARSQPRFDEEPVLEATIEDLNREQLESYIAQLKQTRADAAYLNQSFEQVLKSLRIVKNVEGVLHPTLAGLLMFGKYPQEFEPQLVITFVQYYGITEAEKGPRGERFMDNRKFEGPIPEMLTKAHDYISASFRRSSLIDGL